MDGKDAINGELNEGNANETVGFIERPSRGQVGVFVYPGAEYVAQLVKES